MARQQYEQFCLRFSMDNPQHVKLFRIINDLDMDIYRSKNQFIMEALDAYVSGGSEEDFRTKKADSKEAYVTKKEMEHMKAELREDIRKELYRDLIVHMADTLMGAVVRQPVIAEQEGTDVKKEEHPVSEEMMENVMKWG